MKIGQLWCPVAPQPYCTKTLSRSRKLPGPWTTTWSKQYLSAVHSVTCSLLWVRCQFDRFSISDFVSNWLLKWKFSKMSYQFHRRDTELRSVAKFGENRPLRSYRKIVRITTHKKLALRGTRSSQPHFAQNGPIAPKIPWTLSPLDQICIPNLVRIGCALPDLFRKDWFLGPKNIGFEPTIISTLTLLFLAGPSPSIPCLERAM